MNASGDIEMMVDGEEGAMLGANGASGAAAGGQGPDDALYGYKQRSLNGENQSSMLFKTNKGNRRDESMGQYDGRDGGGHGASGSRGAAGGGGRGGSRGGGAHGYHMGGGSRSRLRGYYNSSFGAGRQSSAGARRSTYASAHHGYDHDELMMDYDYAYPKNPGGLIFNVTYATLRPEQIVRNTITSNFLKEQIEDPLFIQAYRPQEVFKISFKKRDDCNLHAEYIKFLKRKEAERHEAQLKRRQEL